MKKLVFLVLLLLVACSQRELPQETDLTEPLTLEKHVLPQVVNPGGTYLVSVRVSGGADVDSVQLDVYEPEAASPINTYWLYDDGGNLHPDDGDVVAYDGYFSNRITWTTEGAVQQEYEWRFQAKDIEGNTAEPLQATISSRKNAIPQLESVTAPDSLPSGFEGQLQFQALVSDSNGVADIEKVVYEAYQNDMLNFQAELEAQGDGLYVQTVDKLFAVGKGGWYDFRFKAIDKSEAESNIISRRIKIVNHAPEFFDFVHADSVQLPAEGNIVAFLITARVEDDQSLADIKDVKLEWKKPDGTYSQNSPFELFDNGLPWNEDFEGWDDGWRGDEKAGDGIYSITGIFDPTQPLGDYELTFYATDFAGNTSERFTQIVTLYPREDN